MSEQGAKTINQADSIHAARVVGVSGTHVVLSWEEDGQSVEGLARIGLLTVPESYQGTWSIMCSQYLPEGTEVTAYWYDQPGPFTGPAVQIILPDGRLLDAIGLSKGVGYWETSVAHEQVNSSCYSSMVAAIGQREGVWTDGITRSTATTAVVEEHPALAGTIAEQAYPFNWGLSVLLFLACLVVMSLKLQKQHEQRGETPKRGLFLSMLIGHLPDVVPNVLPKRNEKPENEKEQAD